MKWLDDLTECVTRRVAQRTSRRSFLRNVSGLLVGSAGTVPLLPIARGQQPPSRPVPEPDDGDQTSCDYWRYCAVDGNLCACCGGSASTCPPGTEMSPITWIGTCENPADGMSYIISYNDCCGKSNCGACLCNRNEGDRPVYQPRLTNGLNWCLGTASQIYNCSTAVVIGTALNQQ